MRLLASHALPHRPCHDRHPVRPIGDQPLTATRGHSRLAAAAFAALLALPGTGSVAQTFNVGLLEDRSAGATFADGLQLSLLADQALTSQRLLNSRLGTLDSTTLSLTLSYSQLVSLLDPGVSTAPAADRPLMDITQRLTLQGAAIEALNGGTPYTRNTLVHWFCPAPALQCSSAAHSVSTALTPPTGTLTQPTGLLSGLTLTLAPAVLTPQAAGVALVDTGDGANTSGVSLKLRVTSTYAAKSSLAYAGDALAATAPSTPLPLAQRLGLAVGDITALRQANYGTLPNGPGEMINTSVLQLQPLQQAQSMLSATRSLALWQEAVSSGATALATDSRLAAQAWNLAALAAPGSGRSLSFASGTTAGDDLAGLRAVLGASDDAGLLASWTAALATPLSASSQPLLQLEGSQFGLTGAQVEVYLLGDGSGLATLDLVAASAHAILRTGSNFDRLSWVSGGPSSGLRVLSPDAGVDSVLSLGEEVYLGEGVGGLLRLEAADAATTITLNNYYNPELLLVASWGVAAAVPEPGTWALWAAGIIWLSWRSHRQARNAARA